MGALSWVIQKENHRGPNGVGAILSGELKGGVGKCGGRGEGNARDRSAETLWTCHRIPDLGASDGFLPSVRRFQPSCGISSGHTVITDDD